MANMNNEQEASLILSQMNPGSGFKFEENGTAPTPAPTASTSTALPPLPLPPLPTPAPGQLPPRRARQAKLAAQAITSQQQQNDEGGDEDGDGDGDMDDEEDGAFEDDMLGYDASDFNFDASGMLDHGTPSGSVSPRSNRPRGRKPKASFGAGLNKESNEYQKLRKENHKNVEKKRRETINDGIKRLAILVPQADKNKSKIINQAAEYIAVLKDEEQNNIEKWTLEKLMMEKTVRELNLANDKLKQALQDKEKEITALKQATGKA